MKLLIAALTILLSFSIAYAVNSSELVDNARLYDGMVIEYQGEVIGDIMIRRNHAWLNINDGGRAIGIWTSKFSAEGIRKVGSYNYVGDTLRVVGIFNRACPQHGGDLDIHAQEINIVQEGYKIEHPVNQAKLVMAGILFLAILGVIFAPILIKRISS
jgi:hypothetical protein